MEELDKARIEALFGGTVTCNKGLKCISGGLENICKAADEGHELYLVCLENDQPCSFVIPVGTRALCKCPIRKYIKQELGY